MLPQKLLKRGPPSQEDMLPFIFDIILTLGSGSTYRLQNVYSAKHVAKLPHVIRFRVSQKRRNFWNRHSNKCKMLKTFFPCLLLQ